MQFCVREITSQIVTLSVVQVFVSGTVNLVNMCFRCLSSDKSSKRPTNKKTEFLKSVGKENIWWNKLKTWNDYHQPHNNA